MRERVYSGKFNIEKMLASFDDMILRQQLFDEMHNDPELSVVFGNSFNVEITAATANKGHSLLKLAGKLGIMPEQIMVCGDTMNDRTILRQQAWQWLWEMQMKRLRPWQMTLHCRMMRMVLLRPLRSGFFNYRNLRRLLSAVNELTNDVQYTIFII